MLSTKCNGVSHEEMNADESGRQLLLLGFALPCRRWSELVVRSFLYPHDILRSGSRSLIFKIREHNCIFQFSRRPRCRDMFHQIIFTISFQKHFFYHCACHSCRTGTDALTHFWNGRIDETTEIGSAFFVFVFTFACLCFPWGHVGDCQSHLFFSCRVQNLS